jgi:hypothetical protein
MARKVLRGSILRVILLIAFCVLVSAFLLTPFAWAQHGGGAGHGGGFGGGHFGGGGGAHMSAPRGAGVPSSHGTGAHGRGSAAVFVPPARFGTGSFRMRPFPVHPTPPRTFPIFGFPVFFGAPFFFGGGFNSYWWPPCGPFWGAGCNFWPYFGYGYGSGWGYGYGGYGGWGYGGYDGGYSPFPGGQAAAPGYESPSYAYSQGARDLAELFFKDGTVYDVTDYWLVDGQLHFMTVDEQGERQVEHVMPFDALDLQTTVDVNTQRGFKFQLRNEPVEQYLQHHPEIVPKVDPERPRN